MMAFLFYATGFLNIGIAGVCIFLFKDVDLAIDMTTLGMMGLILGNQIIEMR